MDSYQAERKRHVTDVTRRAVFVGRIITERNKVIAALRNRAGRILMRWPAMTRRLQRVMWIPQPRYSEGFLAAGHGAAGWQIPQPWITDAHGVSARLDDVIGKRWTLLYTGQAPLGCRAWQELGVPTLKVSGSGSDPQLDGIRDRDGTLVRWLQGKNATAVVLRPDGFIYAAAQSRQPLPPPPAGLTVGTVTTIGATA